MKLKQIDLGSGDATDLDDVLEHVKFSPIAWTHDNKVSKSKDQSCKMALQV